jgi:hypothetical protein
MSVEHPVRKKAEKRHIIPSIMIFPRMFSALALHGFFSFFMSVMPPDF